MGQSPKECGEPAHAVLDHVPGDGNVDPRELVSAHHVLQEGREQPRRTTEHRELDREGEAEGAPGAEPPAEETHRPAGERDDLTDHRPVELTVPPARPFVGMSGEPPTAGKQGCDEHEEREQHQPGPAGPVRDLVVGAAGGVAQAHQPRAPDRCAQDVPEEKPPIAHARRTGQGRDEGPQDADEAAEEHRPAAPLAQRRLRPLPPLVAHPLPHAAVTDAVTEGAADLVADGVAENGAGSGEADHTAEAGSPFGSDVAADQHPELAGNGKSHEGGRLERGEQGHRHVGPWTGEVADAGESVAHRRRPHESMPHGAVRAPTPSTGLSPHAHPGGPPARRSGTGTTGG